MDNKYLKRRKWIVVGAILLVLTLTVTGTYALWNYFKVGQNQRLVAGDIYMKYTETDNTIDIQDAMPTSTYGDDFFEFTIEGKNTYTKPIWYEIVINWGAEPSDRHTRIPDKFLRFRLTEQLPGEEEQEVIANGKYSDFSKGKKIWVNTIAANQKDEIKITYKLYMWVSDEMHLGAGDDAKSSDMDMETWNNDAFASVKVTVNGDFEEKEIEIEATSESCFEYKEYDKKYVFNDSMTEENISACTTYYQGYSFREGESARAYCEGTGTWYGDTLKENIEDMLIEDYLGYYSDDDSNNETYYTKLLEIGILKTESIPTEVVITNYKEEQSECGSDVVIPSKINNHIVTIISNPRETEQCGQYFEDFENFYEGSFFNKRLSSVIIPNTITKIGYSSFAFNNLTKINIPDSVESIGSDAFFRNKLEMVTIGNGIKTISSSAFDDNGILSDEKYFQEDGCSGGLYNKIYGSFKQIEINKSCDEIKNYSCFSPYFSPVHENGLNIYGYENGEKKLCETITIPIESWYAGQESIC